MSRPPTADQVRSLLAPLDDQDRKIVGGVCACMMAEPQRIRDREWLAQRFVEVCVIARHDPQDEASATTEDVEVLRSYAQTRMPDLMSAATALFVRTAEDLRTEGCAVTMERASAIVRGYLER